MPCDGIAVMSLQYGADNALLAAKKDGLQAVVNLLKQLGHEAALKAENVMMVDNYKVTLTPRGDLLFSNVPKNCSTR